MFKDGLGDLMKQAQQMQDKMRAAQEALASAEVTGTAGAGLVSVVMNGRHDVVRVAIDDSVLGEGTTTEYSVPVTLPDGQTKIFFRVRVP